MFESNFPVDKGSYGYGTLWNAFKRLTWNAGEDEIAALFGGTAERSTPSRRAPERGRRGLPPHRRAWPCRHQQPRPLLAQERDHAQRRRRQIAAAPMDAA